MLTVRLCSVLALLPLLAAAASAAAAQAPRREPPASAPPASAPYYSGEPDGYYWYDDPNEDPAKPVSPVALTPGATGATPLSTAWLRTNIDKYRDAAIDDPTPDNVAIFAYLQRLT